MTIREKLIKALEARGETKVDETRRRIAYTCNGRPGMFYFLGKSGSLRIGRVYSSSAPVHESFKRELLA